MMNVHVYLILSLLRKNMNTGENVFGVFQIGCNYIKRRTNRPQAEGVKLF